MYTHYKYFYIHVILLKTIYWMSSHQNLSIKLIVSYCFPSYRHLHIISANIYWGKQNFVSSFPQGVQTRQRWNVSQNLTNFQAWQIAIMFTLQIDIFLKHKKFRVKCKNYGYIWFYLKTYSICVNCSESLEM